jgi:hypothetical protein
MRAIDEAQSHKCLSRTRHPGQRHETTGLRARGRVDDLRHDRDRAVGDRRSAADPPQPATIVERFARRAHQRRQRAIGLGAQEGADVDRRLGPALLEP